MMSWQSAWWCAYLILIWAATEERAAAALYSALLVNEQAGLVAVCVTMLPIITTSALGYSAGVRTQTTTSMRATCSP